MKVKDKSNMFSLIKTLKISFFISFIFFTHVFCGSKISRMFFRDSIYIENKLKCSIYVWCNEKKIYVDSNSVCEIEGYENGFEIFIQKDEDDFLFVFNIDRKFFPFNKDECGSSIYLNLSKKLNYIVLMEEKEGIEILFGDDRDMCICFKGINLEDIEGNGYLCFSVLRRFFYKNGSIAERINIAFLKYDLKDSLGEKENSKTFELDPLD